MGKNKDLAVLIFGAGEINFGSVEGPWNHTLRLERYAYNFASKRVNLDSGNIKFVHPDVIETNCIPGYEEARVWTSIEEARKDLRRKRIDLAILGIPPHFRGSIVPGADLDLRVIQSLPQIKHWLVEKPISASIYSPDNGQDSILDAWAKSGAVVGVGYHLAALKVVTAALDIIKRKNLRVMSTQARYNMAYEFARKPSWWNKKISCGPIIEQATHLANLSLLFAGKPKLSTVLAHTVEHDEEPGRLAKMGIDETVIPNDSRIPRFTNAIWKYESGAVGSLSHSVALHGTTYDVELVIICDGHIFKLVDLYSDTAKLIVHQDGKSMPDMISFENDDPYQTQLERLMQGQPACTYQQALETYALTWAIRSAGEKQRQMSHL